MSYGSSVAEMIRPAKPADLPVVRAANFELMINAKIRYAVHWCRESISRQPRQQWPYVVLAAAYAQLGHLRRREPKR